MHHDKEDKIVYTSGYKTDSEYEEEMCTNDIKAGKCSPENKLLHAVYGTPRCTNCPSHKEKDNSNG